MVKAGLGVVSKRALPVQPDDQAPLTHSASIGGGVSLVEEIVDKNDHPSPIVA